MNPTSKKVSDVSMAKGFFFLILGIVALAWPSFTVGFLLFALTSFVIAIGLTAIVAGLFSIGKNWHWVLSLCLGILAVLLGISFFVYPLFTTVTYIWLLGAALMGWGLLALFSDPAEHVDEGAKRLRTLDGVLGAILGIMIIFFPISTTTVFYWILAWYALIAGIVIIFTAMRLKKQYKKMAPATAAAPHAR
jgi:uncharacterized membrane protein HdeD (DUF308 family)